MTDDLPETKPLDEDSTSRTYEQTGLGLQIENLINESYGQIDRNIVEMLVMCKPQEGDSEEALKHKLGLSKMVQKLRTEQPITIIEHVFAHLFTKDFNSIYAGQVELDAIYNAIQNINETVRVLTTKYPHLEHYINDQAGKISYAYLKAIGESEVIPERTNRPSLRNSPFSDFVEA